MGDGLSLAGQACHQQVPPFPQPSGLPAVVQVLLAGEPSAQMVVSRGLTLLQMYLSIVDVTTGGFIGDCVGFEVGASVGYSSREMIGMQR